MSQYIIVKLTNAQDAKGIADFIDVLMCESLGLKGFKIDAGEEIPFSIVEHLDERLGSD